MELPDWLRAIALIGQHDGDYYLIQVTADGELYALTMGEDAGGDLHTLAVDADGQLIMVPRGESGNYMAVDADGFLTTILKGNYEGALRTVTVDDDGRLSAFVIDSSDAWGEILAVGNAELAARLNPLLRYDRRGDVMYTWDFGDGIGTWDVTGRGTGGEAILSPEHTDHGGYSLKLTCGSDGVHDAFAVFQTTSIPTDVYGLLFAFSIEQTPEDIAFIIKYYDGTDMLTASILWDAANTRLRLFDSTGAWQTIDDDVNFLQDEDLFSFLKVVADVENGTYLRVLCGGKVLDVSAYGLHSTAVATVPHVRATFDVTGNSGANDIVHLDYVVLTAVEPT